LPALTKFYPGLMPWHVERMTLRELTEYVRQMDEFVYAQAKDEGVG
jgi:hypothetical protein